jgi:hypothetical protein
VASFDAFASSEGVTVELEDGVIAIPDSADDEEPARVQATHILIHNALVVEVQSETIPTFSTEEGGDALLAPSTGFIITFALEPNDVERLVFAASYGQLWLASQTLDDVGGTEIVTLDSIFEGT